jgi:hypothetical protein
VSGAAKEIPGCRRVPRAPPSGLQQAGHLGQQIDQEEHPQLLVADLMGDDGWQGKQPPTGQPSGRVGCEVLALVVEPLDLAVPAHDDWVAFEISGYTKAQGAGELAGLGEGGLLISRHGKPRFFLVAPGWLSTRAGQRRFLWWVGVFLF